MSDVASDDRSVGEARRGDGIEGSNSNSGRNMVCSLCVLGAVSSGVGELGE